MFWSMCPWNSEGAQNNYLHMYIEKGDRNEKNLSAKEEAET